MGHGLDVEPEPAFPVASKQKIKYEKAIPDVNRNRFNRRHERQRGFTR